MAAPTIAPYAGIEGKFIGNPAVYQVTPTGLGTGGTFYRVKLKVVATMTGTADQEFSFSTPVDIKTVSGQPSAQPARFDISSALRAVAEQWQPQAAPQSFTYPVVNFYMQAEEEWMTDGNILHSETSRYPGSSGYSTMYIGALTDRERLTDTRPARYSRKPTTSPEICFYRPNAQGQPDNTTKHLIPGTCYNNGAYTAPSVTAVTVPVASASGYNIYGIPYPIDGYELRFINSLGVHENVFVRSLPSTETDVHTDKYAIARQETLTQFSRTLAIKQNDRERWKLSSGPLDRQWQQWYTHELLMARWAWIHVDGYWLPVSIIPQETTKGIDKASATPMTVEFDIEFDMNGSPL